MKNLIALWLLMKYSWLLLPFGTNRPDTVNIIIQYLFPIILQQWLKCNITVIIFIISINLQNFWHARWWIGFIMKSNSGLVNAECYVINSLCRKLFLRNEVKTGLKTKIKHWHPSKSFYLLRLRTIRMINIFRTLSVEKKSQENIPDPWQRKKDFMTECQSKKNLESNDAL